MDTFTVIVYIAECGREEWNPEVSTRFALGVENEQAGAGRDGTAEPVSRAQIIMRERRQGQRFESLLIPLVNGQHSRQCCRRCSSISNPKTSS